MTKPTINVGYTPSLGNPLVADNPQAAKEREKIVLGEEAARPHGLASTILTGGLGLLEDKKSARKTLLGF